MTYHLGDSNEIGCLCHGLKMYINEDVYNPNRFGHFFNNEMVA